MSEHLRDTTAGSRRCPQEERQTITANEDNIGSQLSLLMEEVLRKENLIRALKRVRANKGAPGVDGMTVDELGRPPSRALDKHSRATAGRHYVPKPVRVVEIPKPSGGTRNARHPHSPGPVHPAGNPAGARSHLRRWILGIQLRLSAWTKCATSRSAGPAVHRRRTTMGGRSRLGEVLRPSQPRHPHEPIGEEGEGQATAETHPSVPSSRPDERTESCRSDKRGPRKGARFHPCFRTSC